MKKKWRTKQDITLLRANANISLQSLADMVYSTNSSLFRIEKLGYCTDDTLARNISLILGISFDDLFEEYDSFEETEKRWQERIDGLYSAIPKEENYSILFLTTYDNYSTYQACVPTVWVGTGSNSMYELRASRKYETDSITDYLNELKIKYAIVENEDDFVHFFYSAEENNETVALIASDCKVIDEISKPLEIQMDYPFVNRYGFVDCYFINHLFV